MGLRVRTDRWTNMLLAALGLGPFAACGFDTQRTSPPPKPPDLACHNPAPVVDGASGFVRCENGTIHRPVKGTCTTTLPRPDVFNPGINGLCTRDVDCGNPHSYCREGVAGLGEQGSVCEHGCVSDDECMPDEVCLCGPLVGSCWKALCKSDADCPPDLPCSSYWDNRLGCPAIFFSCQTPSDECAVNADCGAPNNRCELKDGRRTCVQDFCGMGRPFCVGDGERVAAIELRGDWVADDEAPRVRAAVIERAHLAAAWTRMALAEHASIASFARFTLHLMSVGAPSAMIEASNAAVADETLHAKLAFSVASAYAGRAIGPGPLDVCGALARSSLPDIVVAAIREGCVGETLAAVEAAEALERATDPAVRRVLSRIAADEARHAALAWQFVAWVVRDDRTLREVARDEFARACEFRAPCAPTPTQRERRLIAAGILPESVRQEVRAETLSRVVSACADRLLREEGGVRAA